MIRKIFRLFKAKKYVCHLFTYIEHEVRAKDGSAYYRMEKDIYESRTFKTKDAAINAGRSSTKGCLDLFYEVEEVK